MKMVRISDGDDVIVGTLRRFAENINGIRILIGTLCAKEP